MFLELGPMSGSPGQCTLCGCVPVDETSELREPLPAVHAVGLDVNWGDDVYICWTCSGVIANLIGRLDDKTVKKLVEKARLHKAENEELKARNKELEEIFERLNAGRQATRDAKAAVA